MTRDEVVEGLALLRRWDSPERRVLTLGEEWKILEAAIAYMTPPTTEEIEAAREWLHCLVGHKHTALKALDALAREPATEAVLHRKNVRIAALEARAIESDRNHKQVIAEQAVNIAALEAEVAEGRRIVFGPARDRIAVLEARLARVREAANCLLNEMGTPPDNPDHCDGCAAETELRAALAAEADPTDEWQRNLSTGSMVVACNALAADAGPAVPYVHADCIASGHRCGPGCAVDVMADLPAKPDAGPAGSGWKCACGCDGSGAHHAIPTALPTDVTVPGRAK